MKVILAIGVITLLTSCTDVIAITKKSGGDIKVTLDKTTQVKNDSITISIK